MMKTLRTNCIVIVAILVILNIVKVSCQTVYSCNASASCGCSLNSSPTVSRIVGGEVAASGAWGWTVSISINNRGLCGGSILSSLWVITAAHCIEDNDPIAFVVYAGSSTRWNGTQVRNVSNVFVHPKYDSGTFEYDIALFRLASPFNMSDPNIRTICLPSVSNATLAAGEWPPIGINVVTVGWGRLSEYGSLPLILQQVTLQTVDSQAPTCNVSSLMANPQVQFCAGSINGTKDTCQGDSGGPLMMFNASNQWILVGLTSSGIGCARPQYSGLYTRVAFFQDWIKSYMIDSNSTNSTGSSNSSNSTYTQTTAAITASFPGNPLYANTISPSIFNVFLLVATINLFGLFY